MTRINKSSLNMDNNIKW